RRRGAPPAWRPSPRAAPGRPPPAPPTPGGASPRSAAARSRRVPSAPLARASPRRGRDRPPRARPRRPGARRGSPRPAAPAAGRPRPGERPPVVGVERELALPVLERAPRVAARLARPRAPPDERAPGRLVLLDGDQPLVHLEQRGGRAREPRQPLDLAEQRRA